jgi:hypothetical protein
MTDKQKPVAHVYRMEANGRPMVAWDDATGIEVGAKLYAAPRPWVGLTDEQINQYDYEYRDLLYDAEKMLRENNT